jgi:hypothetical protein
MASEVAVGVSRCGFDRHGLAAVGAVRRYAMRRDAVEPGIVAALERIAQVERMVTPCDLLVRYRRRVHLLEVKDPDAREDKRQQSQIIFLREWEVPKVRNIEEALKAIGAIK